MSATASISTTPGTIAIVSRVAASLLGGWLFVWGCTTLGIVLGLHAGVAYREAVELAYLLAFLLFLTVVCWAFAAASVARVWAVLAGGGALMSLLAWALARIL
jgi:hypothetical protein